MGEGVVEFIYNIFLRHDARDKLLGELAMKIFEALGRQYRVWSFDGQIAMPDKRNKTLRQIREIIVTKKEISKQPKGRWTRRNYRTVYWT